jgi:uncharacterized membrane protein HdeD (DUF308 family)
MNQLSYNWWAVALRGVLALVVGLSAFLFPGITLAVIIALFGTFVLLDGIFLMISGIRSRKEDKSWGVLILQGIIGIAAGVFTFLAPLATALALLYLMASWAIVSGIIEIAAAIRLRKEITGEWMLIADGLFTVLFGIALALMPAAGLLVWMWMIGGFKFASGIVLLLLAFRLRKTEKNQPANFRHHTTMAT